MADDPQAELEALRRELQRTAQIPDLTEQMLEVVGIVDAALAPVGVRPVVVGGLAVAYWTTGLYMTDDIDLVMPGAGEANGRLAALGFERGGRHWYLPGRDTPLEAAGSTLELDAEGYVEVELRSGRAVRVQEGGAVLLLRMRNFVATGDADLFRQCLLLVRASAIDQALLERRAGEQSLERPLAAVRETADRIQRGPATLAGWEIAELAQSLRDGVSRAQPPG
jgi:hypothetical protein